MGKPNIITLKKEEEYLQELNNLDNLEFILVTKREKITILNQRRKNAYRLTNIRKNAR